MHELVTWFGFETTVLMDPGFEELATYFKLLAAKAYLISA